MMNDEFRIRAVGMSFLRLSWGIEGIDWEKKNVVLHFYGVGSNFNDRKLEVCLLLCHVVRMDEARIMKKTLEWIVG